MTASDEPLEENKPGGEPQDTAAPDQPDHDDQIEEALSEPLSTDEAQARGLADESALDFVADMTKAQQDVVDLTTDLKRLQAEYVNYKRRVERDRELVRENSTFRVLSSLLPVLDDMDRAREHGELEGGFKAVADSLERIVAGLGLVKFGEPGDEFNPNLHEALMHSHSPDVTTTTCQSIVTAGYRIGDRVVRPARVTVVDPEPEPEPKPEAVDEQQ